MPNPLSLRVQFVALFMILGLGAAAYLLRDHISGAVSARSANEAAGKPARRRGRGVPVIVATAQTAANDEVVSAVGTARARRSVMLHAKTDGVVVALSAQSGARVIQGALLCALDSAKAELAVKIAEKRHQEAMRLYERSKMLERRNVNSVARVADARVVAERTELEVRLAKEALRDLKIVAPFDGIVGLPKVEVGDRVTTDMPIVSLDDQQEILVEFDVPEKFAARINVNDTVTAATPSHELARFSGRIEYIDNRIDPTSRTARVRAVIPNGDNLLRPGMSFAVELKLPGSGHTAVPELALQWRKGESYIWVVRKSKAQKVLVKTIKRLNSIVLVDGKVTDGEFIVVEGVQRLRPGRRVTFTPPAGSSGQPDSPKQSRTTPKKTKG